MDTPQRIVSDITSRQPLSIVRSLTQHVDISSLIDKIKLSIEEKNYTVQAELFTELGDYYQKNQKEHLFAAAIYNYVKNVYQFKLKKSNNLKKIKLKLSELEDSYISHLHNSTKENQYSYLRTNYIHKNYLAELRYECNNILYKINEIYPCSIYNVDITADNKQKYYNLQLQKAEQIYLLNQNIIKSIKSFINILIKECVYVLGKPPCKYSIIGFGSLARGEITPYSDLEFAILIVEEREEFIQYFRNLTKLLHMKVINLGETILPSMAIPLLNNYSCENSLDNWFYDDVTPRGFAFDGAMPWACKTPLGRPATLKKRNSLELIKSPRNLAELNRCGMEKEEGYNLVNVLSSATLICGNQKLFEDYCILVQEKLSENIFHLDQHIPLRKTRAIEKINEIITKFSPLNHFSNNSLDGALYDIKNELFRFVSLLLENIALYYGIQQGDIWEKLRQLRVENFIQLDAEINLKIALSICWEIRLCGYYHNHAQREKMAIFAPVNISDMPKNIEKIFQINSINILWRYYYTASPLALLLQNGISRTDIYSAINENYFINHDFFDNNKILKALIHKRFLQYDSAKALLKIVVETDKNPKQLKRLAHLYHITGSFSEAAELYHNLSRVVDESERPEILLELGHVYYSSGNRYQEAIKIFLEIMEIYQKQNNHNLILCCNDLALCYNALSNYEKAKTFADKAIELSITVDKILYRQAIIQSFSIKGMICMGLTNYSDAKLSYENGIKICENIYGQQPNDDVAGLFHNLAEVYMYLKDYEKSLDCYNRAKNINQYVFGRNHPHLARNLHGIANIYYMQGKLSEALKICNQVLIMQHDVYSDENNVDIAWTKRMTGLIYEQMGELKKASEQFTEALHTLEYIFPNHKDHEDIKTLKNDLISVNKKSWNSFYRKGKIIAAIGTLSVVGIFALQNTRIGEKLITTATSQAKKLLSK